MPKRSPFDTNAVMPETAPAGSNTKLAGMQLVSSKSSGTGFTQRIEVA